MAPDELGLLTREALLLGRKYTFTDALAAPTSCVDDRRFDRCYSGAMRAAGGAASAVHLRLAWYPADLRCAYGGSV